MKNLNVVPAIIMSLLAGSAIAGSINSPGKAARPNAGSISLASSTGAALNSDLLKGGGTDDTAALQAVLNKASGGKAVHLIIDGPALVSGLDVYGNTTIECTAGGGFYLKDNSHRAIIRNAHPSRKDVSDEHIAVRGCFLNGNRDSQRKYDAKDDAPFKAGLQFFGVNYLTVENVTLWNIRSFGAWIANARVISMRNVTVDARLPPYPGSASVAEQRDYWSKYRSNIDGVHFNGPIQYLTIDGLKVCSEDDALALNANDMMSDDMTIDNEMGPYVGQGPITDVSISNVVLMDALQGIRLLSSDQRIDRVAISNVTGTVRHRMAILSHYFGASHGNFGSVTFSNVNVDQASSATWADLQPDWYKKYEGKWDVAEEGELPFFSLNGRIESLGLHDVVTKVIDDRPLIRIGPDAAIRTMRVELSVSDPLLQTIPLKMAAGGHIERLSFSLDWYGKTGNAGKSPIQYNGGTIDQLHWLSTPPIAANGK